MAYQESSYGGPRSTYAGPTNNASHFPLSHQQHSPFYPNPNPYPPSNQQLNNATSPPPLPSYTPPHPHPQPPDGQTYQPQRLPYGPPQIHNGGGPLMQPPMSLSDDHFKKPYLPQQQYMSHGPFPFPCASSSCMLWHENGIVKWLTL